MRGPAIIGFLLVSPLLAATAAHASPVGARSLDLTLRGGPMRSASVCGVDVRTVVARAGQRVTALVRLPGRPARRRTRVRVTVERCRNGRWRIDRTTTRTTARRATAVALSTAVPGDLRVRARRLPRGRSSRAAYLRVVRAPARPPADPVVDVPVSFTVRNVNRSALACRSDGAQYRIGGRLVGSRAALEDGPGAVTLYLHEFGWGKHFFAFPMPAYDYARHQAAAGHVAVVVDRLGYDDSPGPNGNEICIGAHADMAHQMVQALRTGAYTSPSRPARSFRRVALGGHSVGAGVAELAAISFRDVDALVLLGWASQGYSPEVLQTTGIQNLMCARGGEPAEPGRPAGYEHGSRTDEDYAALSIADAEPAAVEMAVRLRNRDPCGDAASVAPAVVLSNSRSDEIQVPVLLVFGRADRIYQQPSAGEAQSRAYPGSSDVTTVWIDRAGHALTIQRSAPVMRAQVFEWLARRGL